MFDSAIAAITDVSWIIFFSNFSNFLHGTFKWRIIVVVFLFFCCFVLPLRPAGSFSKPFSCCLYLSDGPDCGAAGDVASVSAWRCWWRDVASCASRRPRPEPFLLLPSPGRGRDLLAWPESARATASGVADGASRTCVCRWGRASWPSSDGDSARPRLRRPALRANESGWSDADASAELRPLLPLLSSRPASLRCRSIPGRPAGSWRPLMATRTRSGLRALRWRSVPERVMQHRPYRWARPSGWSLLLLAPK